MDNDVDIVALHARSVEHFLDRVRAVPPDRWGVAAPAFQSVRELVNHVVGEDLWTQPLVAGGTIEEVGDRLDGDLLGDDPVAAAEAAGTEAVAALGVPGAVNRTVHLSFGDTPASEYAWQLTADHLVHGWDVAAATGGDRRMDDELVAAVTRWYAEREDIYRRSGAVAQRPDVQPASEQDALLVAFGRDPSWTEAHAGKG